MIDSGDWGRAADRNIGTDGGIGAAVVDVWWDGGVGVEGYVKGAGVGVGSEAKLWFDVDSGGGKDEACGGESGGEGASKTIMDEVVGANFADADAFKNMVTNFLGHKIHPCLSTNFVSEATMVVRGFGPYHYLAHEDAPTECAGVILTPWVMPLALGLGAIHLGGDWHLVPSPPCICPISW